MRCAGLLSQSVRKANILRKDFDNKKKNTIREKLGKMILDQGKNVQNQQNSVLDLWGGGLFSDYLLDQYNSVQNQSGACLYEIDSNPELFPALKDYANRKNHTQGVKNQKPRVIPFCGSLAEFIQGYHVQNQPSFDFIWLDYCGTVAGIDDDIRLLKKVANEKTIIALTVFRGRDNVINEKGRNLVIDTYISQSFPLHKRMEEYLYETDKGCMGTYVYRVPISILNKLSYLFKEPLGGL